MFQILLVKNGIGYAFRAVPGADSKDTCGKCFKLTFTREGKFETKGNHKALKGNQLI